MGWLRRFPVSTASLVVYLVACVAGAGLHHHEQGACHATVVDERGRASDQHSAPEPEHDHDQDCAVCKALHLAQAPVTIVTFAVLSLPTGEAWTTPVIKGPPSHHTTAHARAPPR